jgi:steroid 5-alpha reductase family enzyme
MTIAIIAALIVFALFTFTWWLSRKLDNYSFVDVTWSYALGVVAPIYAAFGTGAELRRWLAASIAMLWSIRLGTYLCLRVARHHPHEDVRYTVLREKWKDRLSWNFFLFFQAQGILILLLSAPIFLACLNKRNELSAIEIIGLAVWACGFIGESVSDLQMNAFKRDPSNRGKVCQSGLWRYSRHPNYFFESVIWFGFWLFACGSPYGWITFYAPAMILYFLLRVTGIPLTEECAVKSKGDAYREYQRTTSAFIPWFRR